MNRRCMMLMILGFCWCVMLNAGVNALADPAVTLMVAPVASPSVTAPVTLTATVQGINQPTYEFWARSDIANWRKIRDVSTLETCTWTPDSAGNYTFMVRVSDGVSGARSIALSQCIAIILPSAPTGVSVAVTPTTPISTMTATLTAQTTNTGSFEYAFAVRSTSGGQTTWQVLRDFATSTTCSWTPTAAGNYSVMVLIRTPSSPAGANPLETATVNCTVITNPEPGNGLSVAQYAKDKSAAVSYMWDGGMICHTDVVAPMFTEFGFHTTFDIVAGWIIEANDFTNPEKPGDWTGWRRVLAAGHEIANNTLTHQDLTTLDNTTLQNEVNGSADLIKQHLGINPLTFVYPYNRWNDTVKSIVMQRHIWGREQFIELRNDNFTLDFANSMIDTAIAQRSWIVPYGFGVDGAGWAPISSDLLRQHLTYVKSHAHALWVDTVSSIARYVRERDSAQIQLLDDGDGMRSFSVQCPGLDSTIYNVPLTIKVDTGSGTVTNATASCGTTTLPVTIKPGYILVDVVPGSGTVTVTYQFDPSGILDVTEYAGDRSAAVSYSWDDGMICQTDTIAPLFDEFGFHASFYPVTQGIMETNNYTAPNGPADWTGWRRVLAAGHEVGSHTLTHQDLTTLDSTTMQNEVNGSADAIKQHLGFTPMTFAYPFNHWDEITKAVVQQRYIWDREEYITLTTENFTLAFANNMIDTAIAQRKWIIPSGHGVDGYGWSPISSSVLREHLNYVKSQADSIWVDTAANVAKYVKERGTAQLQLLDYASGQRSFTVQCSDLDAGIYTVPLTVKIQTDGITATEATASRGTTTLPVTIKPGYLLVDVIPGSGTVIVTYQ